jgi:flagellar basal body-associated protein FliL
MDNNKLTNKLDSIFSSSNPSLSSNRLGNIELVSSSWKTWVIVLIVVIILIFAYLGYNFFNYLAKGTQETSNFLVPLFVKVAEFIGQVPVQATNISAQGTSTTAQAVQQSASNLQNVTSNQQQQQQQQQQQPNIQNPNNALTRALQDQEPQLQQTTVPDYSADDSYSSIQSAKQASKSGWCFIGEDRGVRTCISVGENDTCMSGDIFPTSEVCVNPKLRP